jgi:hypothetical protein
MLPLAAGAFPTTAAELSHAIERGLAAHGVTARRVRVEGDAIRALREVGVDLTGGRLARDFRVVTSASESLSEVGVQRLEIRGTPVMFENTPLELRIDADHARMGFAGSPQDGALLLTNAQNGTVSVSITHAALESLLHALASSAAGKQGVEIKRTRVEFTARGPRALSFCATVTAKVFVMSADLSISGDVDIDDQLNARLSHLALGGDPMITKLAGTFIRPYLEKLDGRVVPLLAFSPGEMKLRDVELAVHDGLEVRAGFGGSRE